MNLLKRNFGKYFSLLLSIVCFFGNLAPIYALHGEVDNEMNQRVLEDEMKNIDVIKELEELKLEFANQLIVEKDEIKRNQLELQIKELDRSINIYSNYIQEENSKDTKYVDSCAMHDAAKSMIVAYFNFNGYKLSAELLNYAFANDSENAEYYPTLANIQQIYSSEWFSTVEGLYPISGSSRFPKDDIPDLYYSIHQFAYHPSSLAGYVNITDRYDYEEDQSYPSATGVAVNAMYEAQVAGCLIPYNVEMAIQTLR